MFHSIRSIHAFTNQNRQYPGLGELTSWLKLGDCLNLNHSGNYKVTLKLRSQIFIFYIKCMKHNQQLLQHQYTKFTN
jgi:hypothetical protein